MASFEGWGRHNWTTDNSALILFNSVKGENISLSFNSTIARITNFWEGICFSNRPIGINEKVFIKYSDIFQSECGGLCFGFTTNNPTKFHSGLPSIACPDLTDIPGNWARPLKKQWTPLYEIGEYILYFYVNELGDVHYGINGEERGIFLSGVTINCPLWALFDIYGNTISIELLDPRKQLNGRRDSYERKNIIPSPQIIDTNREPFPQIYRYANFLTQLFVTPKSSNQMDSKPTNAVKNGSNSDSLNAIGNECKVCYEEPINSVLSKCGHLCMCYGCALKQWQESGICPICRAVIKDVIRTYWS